MTTDEGTTPEWRVARSALQFLGVVAVPVVGVAWLAAGTGGLYGSGIAVALVAGLFGMSALFLGAAARFGPGAMMGAALGGFALRLMVYALLLVLLRPVAAIDGTSLAVSAAVLLVATLAWEARHVSRDPRFFWIDPERNRA